LQKDFTLRFETDSEKREKEKNGLNGFYSSIRFILPPDITDAELTKLRVRILHYENRLEETSCSMIDFVF